MLPTLFDPYLCNKMRNKWGFSNALTLVCLLYYLLPIGVHSQSRSYYFEHISTEDGLSNNWISAIVQDNKGYIWVGTYDGLNRYDGYDFKVFRTNSEDENSLSHDRVKKLYCDARNSLWITSKNKGVDRFNLSTGQFKRYPFLSSTDSNYRENEVTSIFERNENTFFRTHIGSNYRFNEEEQRFEQSDSKYNNRRNRLGRELSVLLSQEFGEALKVNAFLKTESAGTFVALDKIGLVQISSKSQINVLRNADLDESVINSLIQDRTGSIWIGTNKNGIFKFNPNSLQFDLINDFTAVGILGDPDLRAITKDDLGNYWVGTKDNGLIKFQDQFTQYTVYKPAPNDAGSLSSRRIRASFKDQSGDIWAGGYSGLSRYEPSTDQFVNYDLKSVAKGSYRVYGITQDHAGILWVANWENLVKVDPERGVLETISKELFGFDNIREVFVDSRNHLWIGAEYGGLVEIDLNTSAPFSRNEVTSYKEFLSDENVYGVIEDSANNIWVATINGLNKIIPSERTVETYSMKDGLPSNLIYDLVSDESGDLWLITSNGIGRLHMKSGEIQNFNVKSGLQGNEFTEGALYLDETSSEIVAVGVEGLNMFYPKGIQPNYITPNVVISSLKVLNQEVTPDPLDESATLNQDISYTTGLTLERSDRMVEFAFSALHYTSPMDNMYAYMLEGYDPDWVYVNSNRRYASYMNLLPGEYTFKVKAANSNRIWNEEPMALSVTILPAWWETWWFRLLSFLVLFLFVYLIIKWRSYTIESQKRKLNEEVRKKTDQLKDAQSRLIGSEKMASVGLLTAGIAHEINNPLNFIHGSGVALEKYLKKNFPGHEEEFKPLLEALDLGVSRVDEIVKSLNRFNHQSTENKEKCDIKLIINNCLIMLQNQLKNRVSIIKNYTNDEYDLIGFEGELHQVFLNILVNASQAIPGEGSISITTKIVDEQMLLVEIEDTGEGIKEEDLVKVTSPFYTTKPPGSGTGLGMSIGYRIIQDHKGAIHYDSEKGKGTKVSVTLPLMS